jgi:hypothetical protein
MFETDLEQGMEIQFKSERLQQYAWVCTTQHRANPAQITDDGKIPSFALYIDCAGRAVGQSNTETEESAKVQRVINSYATPLLGFYSGVEVTPIPWKSRGLTRLLQKKPAATVYGK